MTKQPITNETIYTINWTENDPRSVKASLNGKGDGRVLWWKVNEFVNQLASPQKALKEIAHSIHLLFKATALLIRTRRIKAIKAAATSTHLG